MLYKGNQEKYQTIIADDEDHELELADQGWLKYGELPERESGMTDPYMESVKSSILEVGEFQYNSEVEAHSQTKLKLETANTEIERLNQIIAVGCAENADLRKKLRIKELEDTSADDLKVLLTEQGIPFGARDSKPTLIELLNANSD